MDLARSVHATIKYAGFFHFPLTGEEIHHWLICSQPVGFESVKPFTQNLSEKDRKYRQKVLRSTIRKTELAGRLAKILRFVPGLQMVALTGSVAAGNSHTHDDIDLFFITSPHTLWLVRPVVILLISLFFRRRHPGEDHAHAKDAFCPNLWMDSSHITVPKHKQGLYTAREVLQIVPLLDKNNTYQSFLRKNVWTKKYLANAYHALAQGNKTYNYSSLSFFNLLFAPLNFLLFLFQYLYMFPKKSTEHVNLHAAYLHTTDYHSQLDRHLSSSEDI